MKQIFSHRFAIIAVYKENVEKFNKTVSTCVEQMEEEDKLMLICEHNNNIAEIIKKKWKKNRQITVISTDCIPVAYNEIIFNLDSEFILFVHEGDMIGKGYLEKAYAVMNGSIQQQVPDDIQVKYTRYRKSEEDETIKNRRVLAKISDPQKMGMLFPDNYWNDCELSEERTRCVLSEGVVEGTYAVNIDENYWALQTSLNGTIIRSGLIKKFRFNKKIKYEYETDVVLRMILKEKEYLVCNLMKFNYFEPKEMQVLYHIPAHYYDWYFESITEYIFPLLDCEERETASPYLQNYMIYYVLCRFLCNLDNRNKRQIPEEKFEAYLILLKKIFERVEDYYLLNQDRISYLSNNPQVLCMFLRIKYGIDNVHYEYKLERNKETGEQDLVMYFDKYIVTSMNRHRFCISIMNYINDKVWIDGSLLSIFDAGGVKYYAEFDGNKIFIEDTDAYSITKYFGISAYRRLTYHIELLLKKGKKMQRLLFYAEYKGQKIPMKISFTNHWAKLSKNPRYSYWRFNIYLCHHANDSILFKKATRFNVIKREMQFQINLIANNTPESRKALCLRWLYWLTRPYFSNKKIWLMLDKLYKGGDSCEYLYRYSAHKDDGITKYYLINKNTSDYRKLKRDGFRPLINGSLIHKLVFMNADLLLITNSHLFPFNGYTKEKSKYIRGVCNFTSMCLQHGLSVQKCAMAQRRIIDNTTGYFLASKYEYENLSKHAYGYEGLNVLKITGIARYDGLINNDKKQILISPTWRMYNALPVTTSEGEQRAYNPEFKNTMFFKVYNNLINHERLINCAQRTGYKIKFLLHPILSSQVNDFTPNSELEVIPSVGDLSYEKILTESSLMVTDYSGVQFDFAYMRKPIVYFHPSELPAHYEDGIFFYDSMGFGEICTKTEELVDNLCDYMIQGCKMKEEYVKRADDFFAYKDHHNCERIYQELLKAQEQIDHDKMRIQK